MPTYAFRCPTCDTRTELVCRIAELDASHPACCGAPMVQQLFANMGRVQTGCHYKCPATGQWITNRRQRAEVMKQNGLVDADDYASNMQKTKARFERNKELGAKLYKDVPPDVLREMRKMNDDETVRLNAQGPVK